MKLGEIEMKLIKNAIQTPDERSHRDLNAELSSGSAGAPSPRKKSDDYGNSSYDVKSKQKMKMDLSVVSFLKPHVINPDLYKLAHQGFTRQQLLKTDVIKSIEQ